MTMTPVALVPTVPYLALFVFIMPCSFARDGEPFSPSLCYDGFVANDSRCPYLLGKGFGPKPYKHLHNVWASIKQEISTIKSIDPQCAQLMRSMLSEMSACDETKVQESVLSNHIASSFQALMPMMDTSVESKSVRISHQTTVPDGSARAIDITIKDSTQDRLSVHALLEIKWSRLKNKFPESQASYYACLFTSCGANRARWLPVLVLSKTHYQIGVAFDGIDSRWAYAEIASISRTFTPENDDDVIHMLRFAQFFVKAAIYHQVHSPELVLNLVDKKGENLICFQTVLGCRVLQGISSNRNRKVLKFYATVAAAEKALAKQNAISKILDYDVTAELKDGCDPDGFCAIIEDYHFPTSNITIDHFLDLVRQIQALQNSYYAHGDLRLPNIVFCKDGRAILIDFEWSGEIGKTAFPAGARSDAFGRRAERHVAAGHPIGPLFDWLCLADILEALGCRRAAEAAGTGNAADAAAELVRLRTAWDGRDLHALLHPEPLQPLPRLDLRCIGLQYYEKNLLTKARGKSGGSVSAVSSSATAVQSMRLE